MEDFQGSKVIYVQFQNFDTGVIIKAYVYSYILLNINSLTQHQLLIYCVMTGTRPPISSKTN
jgi:hypothetical protein